MVEKIKYLITCDLEFSGTPRKKEDVISDLIMIALRNKVGLTYCVESDIKSDIRPDINPDIQESKNE